MNKMGRPREPKPVTLSEPSFLRNVKRALEDKERAKIESVRAIAEVVEAEPRTATRRGVYPQHEFGDPLRKMVYEQSVPAPPADVKTWRDGHISRTFDKTADCPLNYLHRRLEKRNRISDIQFAAGVRYREDSGALLRLGSNTSAVIERLIMAPDLTPEDRWKKIYAVEKNLDQTIACHDDTQSTADPTDRILAAVYRVRRIEDRLDAWELAILREVVVVEKPIGQLAQEWGMAPEAVSVLARMALWKLARIMENIDREFQGWLMIERQTSGEART